MYLLGYSGKSGMIYIRCVCWMEVRRRPSGVAFVQGLCSQEASWRIVCEWVQSAVFMGLIILMLGLLVISLASEVLYM